MQYTSQVINFCWVIFLIYWGVSAMGVKRDVLHPHFLRRRGWLFRIMLLIFFIIILNYTNFGQSSLNHVVLASNPVVSFIAMILTGFGIAFAIWARIHLGRNWSSHPDLKEGHELVTSGPYAIVRHPIYTGIICAVLGSVLVGSLFWFVAFMIIVALFVNRIHVEENLMTSQFPDEYPAYMKRTNALIPWLW